MNADLEQRRVKRLQRRRRRRDLRKTAVDQYKVTQGCQVCGFNAHAVALDFHHPGPKERNIDFAHSDRSDAVIWAEITKCIVLCANCHRVEHHVKI